MDSSNDQKKYIDNIQKSITKTCFKRCFALQNLKTNQNCLDVCYSKYMRTLGLVNDELKDSAHEVVSQYGLKIWPFNPLRAQFYYDDDIYPVMTPHDDYILNEHDITNEFINETTYRMTFQDDLK